MTIRFELAESGDRLRENCVARPLNGRAGELIIVDKQDIIRMLFDYEKHVKSSEMIEPFVSAYFKQMARSGNGGKDAKRNKI